MRIVSLLPSATEIVSQPGLGHRLVGVTHECDYPAIVQGLPKVTRTLIPHDASSREIDENNEMLSDKMLPWDNEPAKNISPFFIFADAGELMRKRTRDVVAKAKAHGVTVETAELNSHTWPFGEAYDQASAFADSWWFSRSAVVPLG